MRQSILLLAATSFGQACDYYVNDQCIKAEAPDSTTTPFAPLLPTSPTFVYALDELDADDIKTQKEKDSFSIPSSLTYKGSILKVAWWLQYGNSTINLDKAQNRQYYAFALETNSTNPVGGGSNGCESLLGNECVRNLKDAVAVRAFHASVILGGLGTVMDELRSRPLRNLSCPNDIFGVKHGSKTEVQAPLSLPTFGQFAEIIDFGRNEGPMPPGDTSFTHRPAQLRFRPMEEQKKRGIVAVTVSWPALESNKRNYSMSDVMVEMACLRVDGAGGGGGGGCGGVNNGGTSGDGKSMACRSWMSGEVMVAMGVAVMFHAFL